MKTPEEILKEANEFFADYNEEFTKYMLVPTYMVPVVITILERQKSEKTPDMEGTEKWMKNGTL